MCESVEASRCAQDGVLFTGFRSTKVARGGVWWCSHDSHGALQFTPQLFVPVKVETVSVERGDNTECSCLSCVKKRVYI